MKMFYVDNIQLQQVLLELLEEDFDFVRPYNKGETSPPRTSSETVLGSQWKKLQSICLKDLTMYERTLRDLECTSNMRMECSDFTYDLQTETFCIVCVCMCV